MSWRICIGWTLALWLWSGPFRAFAAEELPPSPEPHYILDEAGWLTPGQFSALDQRLEEFERKTSNQVVVAIFRQLPENAELFDFSQRVFAKWKPGLAEKDNGVILFLFARDRKIRIHTGYGLEGPLPDALAGRIIKAEITPLLREEKRAEAVDAGVTAILAAIQGEYKGTGTVVGDRNERTNWVQYLPALIVLGLVSLMIIRRITRRADDVYTGGGWIPGGWSSDGGGGWSSGDGGGFSGGGGDSGGGGASGDW
ncbi:MAG: TPM domain-containing protein [Verrucomicrobiota bacterium]